MDTPSISHVFLSHSSLDTQTVEKALRFLEDHGFPCWIAPRDISPGEDWPSAIASAVDRCSAFLLFVSRDSNQSGQVRVELERAVLAEKKVIPLFIEECRPTSWMEYFISSRHWHTLNRSGINDSLAELLPVLGESGDQLFSRDLTLLDSFLAEELNALAAGISILEELPGTKLVPGRMRPLAVVAVNLGAMPGNPGDEAYSLIRSSVTRIAEQVTRGYGGIPEILDRDVTLGFFGLGETREDDVRRAVSCAIRINRMMAVMNEKLSKFGFSPEFGIGVSSGMVRTGEAVSVVPSKSETTVQEAIALASAEGMTISEETRHRCSRLFNWHRKDLGWTIRDSAAVSGSSQDAFTPVFHGRNSEISKLVELSVKGSSERSFTAARIIGESGIGKSRLAEAVAEEVASIAGIKVFRGRCHPFSKTPLFTIRSLFDSIPIPEGLLSEGNSEKLLGRIRGEELPDESWTPEDLELETALFLAALLRKSSVSCPAVLLLIDNVQWMDRESRKVFERLITFMDTGVPVLFLLVERAHPGDKPKLFPDAEELNLDGLSVSETAALAGDLLQARTGESGVQLFSGTLDYLTRASRGNPMALISLIDHLLEYDLISPETGKWRITGKASDLPEGDLKAILLWRLSKLDAAVNAVLQVASVTSGVFDADSIQGLNERAGCEPLSPGMALQRLQSTGMITAVPGGFCFSSEVVREAILETVVPINRKLLHKAAAEYYESLAFKGSFSDTVFICSSFLKAEIFRKAFSWGLKAIRRMTGDSQLESAVVLSDELYLNTCSAIEGISSADWAEYLLSRAFLLRETGDWNGALQCYDELLEYTSIHELGEHEARTRVLRSQHLISLGKYGEAVRELESLLGSQQLTLEKPLEITVLRNLGVALWRSGNLQGAEECFQKNLKYAESSGDSAARGIALGNLALVHASFGDTEKALEFTGMKLETAIASGSLKEQSIAESNMGALNAMLGKFEEAENHFLNQLAIDEKLGRRQGILAALSNLANLKSRYETAADRLSVYRRAESLARKIGDRNSLMHILGNMAPILLEEQMKEEAASAAGEALDLAVSAGNSSLVEKNRKTLNTVSSL